MKYADIIPIHKKDDKTDKENYHPISILPSLTEVYERQMYNQICPYFDTFLTRPYFLSFNVVFEKALPLSVVS